MIRRLTDFLLSSFIDKQLHLVQRNESVAVQYIDSLNRSMSRSAHPLQAFKQTLLFYFGLQRY